MSLHESLFTVRAVHDGDTMKGDLDLGFFLGLSGVSLRIYGINAPELTLTQGGHRAANQAGEDATLHLLKLLGWGQFAGKRLPATFGIPGDYLALPGKEPVVLVRTRIKTGDGDYEKYGRILGEVFLGKSDDPYGPNIGAQMIADGFAVEMLD